MNERKRAARKAAVEKHNARYEKKKASTGNPIGLHRLAEIFDKTIEAMFPPKKDEIIRVVTIDGSGKSPDAPCREVSYYYDMDGNLVFKQDPCKEIDL